MVNGQKIWTTLAIDANWIFLLVRTDKAGEEAGGHLLSAGSNGQRQASPCAQSSTSIWGRSSARTFSTMSVCRSGNTVGEMNKGWTMAKNLLGFERIVLGSPRQSAYALARFKVLPNADGRLGRSDCSGTVIPRCGSTSRTTRRLYAASSSIRCAAAKQLGPDVSMLKIFQTELYQQITDTMLEIAGRTAG